MEPCGTFQGRVRKGETGVTEKFTKVISTRFANNQVWGDHRKTGREIEVSKRFEVGCN